MAGNDCRCIYIYIYNYTLVKQSAVLLGSLTEVKFNKIE